MSEHNAEPSRDRTIAERMLDERQDAYMRVLNPHEIDKVFKERVESQAVRTRKNHPEAIAHLRQYAHGAEVRELVFADDSVMMLFTDRASGRRTIAVATIVEAITAEPPEPYAMVTAEPVEP